MKPLFLITLFFIFFISCHKDIKIGFAEENFVEHVKEGLRDSLAVNDFENLNFSEIIKTKKGDEKCFVRIGFIGKDISRDFVLLETDNSGNMLRGLMIKLNKDGNEKGKEYEFNGYIKLTYLNRSVIMEAPVVNGAAKANKENTTAYRSLVVPTDKKDTTVVVVTGNIPTDGTGNVSYSDWINATSIFGNYVNYGGIYIYGGGYNGKGLGYSQGNKATGYGDGRGYSGPILETDPLFVDYEPSENLSAIDVTKYLKCFSNIPDLGASCSIEILADIPVDKDPYKLFNWKTGSPGHTFIQLKKTNGSKTVMQNIGFYPAQGWKTLLTNAPVTGKFVDNGVHEFNASLKMNVTTDQFKSSLSHLTELSKYIKYDIDEYNCTDFALDVFNYTRVSNSIEIPKYQVPGGMTANGTNTPQGLYNKLVSMQQAGAESPNITIPPVKGYVAESNGPCN